MFKMLGLRDRKILLILALLLLGLIFLNYFKLLKRDINEDGFSSRCDYKNYILGPGARMDDPCLIEVVRRNFLVPPSTLPYNLSSILIPSPSNSKTSAIWEKHRLIKKYIIDKNGPSYRGFFIDCGANDGEFISTTIDLEKLYGWDGLLIEANPYIYETLRRKNRKAWSINAGACVTPYAQKITLFVNPEQNGGDSLTKKKDDVAVEIQCIPLYTMLAALNVTMVDYFSLDVEGVELEILKTIPFDRIQFKMLTVEYIHIPGDNPDKQLEAFMRGKGYRYLKKVNDYFTADMVFIHESLAQVFRNEFFT